MSAARLRDALAELEARWAANGVVLADRVGTGASPNKIADILAAANLPVPPEVAEWFGWQGVGGADTAVGREIGPAFEILSLDNSVQARVRTLDIVDQLVGAAFDFDGEPSQLWHPAWLPIAITPDGRFGVECVPGATESRVWAYEFGPAVATQVAGSLAELVEGWIELIDQGWWVWNEFGYWERSLDTPAEMTKYFEL
jgi:cell wall assembly regulator SMI1